MINTKTNAQSDRQAVRKADGRYAKGHRCGRCGCTVGFGSYCSFMDSAIDGAGNQWGDQASICCGRCAVYLEKLEAKTPGAPFIELTGGQWGQLPRGKAAI